MKTIFKWISGFILGLLTLWIIAGCFIIFYIIPRTDIKKIVEQTINQNITSKSKVDEIDFTFFSSFPDVTLNIDNFLIYDSITMDTIVSAERAELDLNPFELLENRISVRDIEISKPYLNFYIDSLGNSNIDSLIKITDKKKTMESPVINLNNLAIREGRFDYHEISTGVVGNYANLNFDFQGRINLKDSVLDIRHGNFFVGENSLTFFGHADPYRIDFSFAHNMGNLNGVSYIASIQQIEETDITGIFHGNYRIEGKLGTTFDSITISGYSNGENIHVNSSKESAIVTGGNFSSRFKYTIGLPDSSYFLLDTLNLQGEFLSLAARGKMTIKDSDLYIYAHLKTDGNLTELSKKTSIIPISDTLQGKLKADITISSSLHDLMHKYRFPSSLKKLYDLDIGIKMPDIEGMVNIANLKVSNDTIHLKAKNINLKVNGKNSRFTTKFNDLVLSRNGKIENTTIKAQNGNIDIDGKRTSAKINITEAGFVDVVDSKDSIIVLSHLINLNLKGKNKNFAEGWFESFSYRRGATKLFGAKINGKLSKSSKKSKKPWDTGELESYITRFEDNNLNLFSKRITGTFQYNGKLYGLKSSADSTHVITGDNELFLKGININAESEDSYSLVAKVANTEKSVLGFGVNINNLNALYHVNTKKIDVKTGRITAGKSDFSASGSIDVSQKMPIVNVNLVGKYLNINEIIVAGNRMNLAMGNPIAIPLDSIPHGKLPRSGGKIGKNMSIGLKLDRLTLTTLEVSNVTGEILMRDKATLINNLQAFGKGYNLCLNTKYTFINRGLSITDINLNLKDFEISEIATILPAFAEVTPMLSSLKGKVNLDIILSTPIRYFIGINMKECKAAVKLEAKGISITDNETFRKIAKTLMFKNKENTYIDSLAVAATIRNSQVKFFPFMLKVDRYNVGMYGENDIITKQVNYHVCVLKSPVPFKFGIDITGIPKYQIRLVKSGYKQLNPEIKPWTNPEFEQLRNSLIKPIDDFRNSIIR